jgi:hypothetical protein
VLKAEIARADLDFGIYTIITSEKSERDIAEEKYDELNEDIYGWVIEIERLESDIKGAVAERDQLREIHGFGMME